jgi:histidine triad (HIT) family protein
MPTTSDCPLCRVAATGVTPTSVYDDDQVIAVMDIRPIRPGHVIVVPRVHVPDVIDLDGELAARLFHVAQRIGRAQRAVFQPVKVGFLSVGIETPHSHLHVIPLQELLDLASPALLVEGLPATRDELASHAELLRRQLALM